METSQMEEEGNVSRDKVKVDEEQTRLLQMLIRRQEKDVMINRITALAMCLCAFPLGMDGKSAFRIVKRDHANHLSPNCAWPESAAAGALGVQLGGTHEYFGKTVVKPTIGDDTRPPEEQDIRRLNRLMFFSAGLMLAIVAGAAWLV